jgi:pimeloyl-ACP methyl ester carboxylesterase
VLLHGGLLTIDLNFGPLLEPLAASRQVIAVELQGHGHTSVRTDWISSWPRRTSGAQNGASRVLLAAVILPVWDLS